MVAQSLQRSELPKNSESFVEAMLERYLDHATTSAPKAPGVADEIADALRGICASPGRSSHGAARKAAHVVAEARQQVASFFGCEDPDRVIFTSGATAAMNLALKGILRAGDHVVATSFDHNSTLRPLARLRGTGVRVTVVRRSQPDEEFVAAVAREIRPQTRMVVVNHASNVLGCVLPLEAIGANARRHGVLVLLDTAQTAGLLPVDLSRAPVDLLVFSGHKSLLGPPGIGGLIAPNRDIALTPLLDGGTGYLSEELEPPLTFPSSYEAGTPNTPAIAALATAIAFHKTVGRGWGTTADAIRERCVGLLNQLPGVIVYNTSTGPHVPVVSFRVVGIGPQRVASVLDSRFGINVRAGLHCAPLTHQAIGTSLLGGTVRASFGFGSTTRSADLLCSAIEAIVRGV
jgi:cysteine desulfurase family protein